MIRSMYIHWRTGSLFGLRCDDFVTSRCLYKTSFLRCFLTNRGYHAGVALDRVMSGVVLQFDKCTEIPKTVPAVAHWHHDHETSRVLLI